jgi:hypothetical protein
MQHDLHHAFEILVVEIGLIGNELRQMSLRGLVPIPGETIESSEN